MNGGYWLDPALGRLGDGDRYIGEFGICISTMYSAAYISQLRMDPIYSSGYGRTIRDAHRCSMVIYPTVVR